MKAKSKCIFDDMSYMEIVYTAHWSHYDDFTFVGVFSDRNRAQIEADEYGRKEWLERLHLIRFGNPEYLLHTFMEGPTPGGVKECRIDERVWKDRFDHFPYMLEEDEWL
jgi:hypothetical protein